MTKYLGESCTIRRCSTCQFWCEGLFGTTPKVADGCNAEEMGVHRATDPACYLWHPKLSILEYERKQLEKGLKVGLCETNWHDFIMQLAEKEKKD